MANAPQPDFTCYRCSHWPCECADGITLICGDALRVLAQLDGESVDVVLTDPPYSSGGQFRGDRVTRTTTQKYQLTGTFKSFEDFAGDNRDQRAFGYWCSLWLFEALRTTKAGGVVAMFSDWRQLPTVTDVLQSGGWVWRGVVPWDKTEAARPTKGRYRNQCEYLVWGSHGAMEHAGPCLPGMFRQSVRGDDKRHITGKPLSVMRQLVEIAWRDEARVLDPFCGSGTTLVAAKCAGKKAIGIEISEHYCEVAANRLRQEVLFA